MRERLMRWLARGEVDIVDPDAMVEVAEVMLHEGPMLVSALHRAGIPAHGVEAWNMVTKITDRMRIFVRAVDAGQAMEEIQRLKVRLGRPMY